MVAEILNLERLKKELADISLYGPYNERMALLPPENITVSEWAEKNRVLPKSSAIPGKWKNSLGPYAVGVMDAWNDPWVERITIMASVQSMKTESVYNMLGWAISQDPAPALVVMPTLNSTKKVNRRIRKMLIESEDLRQHLTGNPDDLQLSQIVMDRMEIYFATAGSEADLQNIESRYVICDETDEYQVTADSGDLVEKAIDRATTYWNRKIALLSRPTTLENYITGSYAKSDRRKYWVPCPFCGRLQILKFWQVKHTGEVLGKWPKELQDPEYIKLNRVARYECLYCQAEIDDRYKQAMLAGGAWYAGPWLPWESDNQPKEPETTAYEGKTHVGFWWNVLYSPFRSFSEIAAQYFKVKDDRDAYRIFVNQWLAEPWREIVKQRSTHALLELRSDNPPLVVPPGTIALTAGIDNQRRGMWVSLWAWVRRENSATEQHLIRYGYLPTWLDLETWLFTDVYHAENGLIYPVWRSGIDTGGSEGEIGELNMTEDVYQWLRLRSQGRVFGIKGSSRDLPGGKKMRLSIIDKMPQGGLIPGGLRLWILDTQALKDAFWSRLESGLVYFHADTQDDFVSQLTAEAKERTKSGRFRWTRQGRRANHLLDTTIYAMAMADPECWGGVMVLPKPDQGKADLKVDRGGINSFTGRPQGAWLGK